MVILIIHFQRHLLLTVLHYRCPVSQLVRTSLFRPVLWCGLAQSLLCLMAKLSCRTKPKQLDFGCVLYATYL